MKMRTLGATRTLGAKRTLGATRSPRSEQGFVLPVVLGIGLIMSLLGVVLINRSIQNRITATAQKETSQSSAAAEAGIAQIQSLLNRYPALAKYCSKKTLDTLACDATKDWQTIAETDLAPCPALTTEASDLIKSYADDLDKEEWQMIGSNPSEGQFRLVSYKYPLPSPHPLETGELVIEGKIGTESLNTSTTKLSAKFTFKSAPPPALWIQSNEVTNIRDSTQIKSHIRDSTCPNPSTYNSQIAEIKSYQLPSNTYHYKLAPGEAFPNFSKPNPRHYRIQPIDKNTKKLPRPDDNVQDGQIIYTVEDHEREWWSLNLRDNSTLDIGTDRGETIVLYLSGKMSIRESSKIKIARGSKLIIYTQYLVEMAGNSTDPIIEQVAESINPMNVQFYVSSSDETDEPHSNFTIEGGSGMSLFLLAPESQVTLKSRAKVTGVIWSKSFQGLDSSEFAETNTNFTDLKLKFPSRIFPLTAWERVP